VQNTANCCNVFLSKLKITRKYLRWIETAEAANILKAELFRESIQLCRQ